MKSLLRRRPSPAMIVALIALFVSLSGVSYGVATGFIDSREIKNNEVRSIDIRNNEIRTRDLRNNEVRGIDIRNSTVQGRDIAPQHGHGRGREGGHPPEGAERAAGGLGNDTRGLRRDRETIRGRCSTRTTPRSPSRQHGPFTLRAQCVAELDGDAVHSSRSRRRRTAVAARSEDLRVLGASNADDGDAYVRLRDATRRAGNRAVDLRNVAAVAPSGKSFTGQIAIVDGRGHGQLHLRRAPGPAGLDLDDDRQDHRAPLEALVDELGHVVVEVVLQEVDLA